jgi:hypothetical protein
MCWWGGEKIKGRKEERRHRIGRGRVLEGEGGEYLKEGSGEKRRGRG